MAALVNGRLLCKLDNDKTEFGNFVERSIFARLMMTQHSQHWPKKKSAVWIVSCFNLLEK